MKILGLDASSTVVGWAVYDTDEKKFVDFGYIKSNKRRKAHKVWTFIQKFDNLIKKLEEVSREHKVDRVYIEEPLKRVIAGRSSANTIVACAKANGAVQMAVRMCFGPCSINDLSARSIRAKLGLKTPKGEDTKEHILREMVSRYPYLVPNKEDLLTEKGNYRSHFFDLADACVVALGGSLVEEEIERDSKQREG